MSCGRDAGGAVGVDIAEIKKAIALFADPAHTMELRAIGPSVRPRVRAGSDIEGLAREAEALARSHRAVYFGMNPRTIPAGEDRAAGASEVARRRWLAADIDAVRPADTSSTDAELLAARGVADSLAAAMRAAGWPDPWLVLSGNGYHAYWMIDLPADDASQALVKAVLEAMARLHDTHGAAIDRKVCDAPRIMRLPGTPARKGEDTADRPHRTARLVCEPDAGEVVTEDMLREFVEANRPPEPETDRKAYVALARAASGTWRERYRNKAVDDECARVTSAASGGRNNALNRAAFALGQLVGGGVLDEGAVTDRLASAADAAGLDAREIPATIKSGLDSGRLEPRGYPERPPGAARKAASRPPAPPWAPGGGPDDPERERFRMEIVPEMPRPFPAPPHPDAFYGVLGAIVAKIAPETASDPVSILVHLLAMFGNIVGRSAYWEVEEKRMHGNLFAVIVGDSAKGKKGTSLSRAESVFRQVDEDWVRNNIDSGLSSGEGLIYAVRDARSEKQPVKGRKAGEPVDYVEVIVDHGVADKRLMLIEAEFAQVLAKAELQASSLVGNLRKAWDGGKLSNKTKTPLVATNAHVSVIGHVTTGDLLAHLNKTDTSNGFANRFWWIASRASRRLPRGGRRVDLTAEIKDLRFAVQQAYTAGEVGMDEEAWDYWENPEGSSLFDRLERPRPGSLSVFCARGTAHVRDVAMLFALSDGINVVRLHHLRAAEHLWDYCERTIEWVFGRDIYGDPIAAEILAALRVAGHQGMTRNDLHDHFSRHKKSHEVGRALGRLMHEDLVSESKLSTGERGRPKMVYRLIAGGGVESGAR